MAQQSSSQTQLTCHPITQVHGAAVTRTRSQGIQDSAQEMEPRPETMTHRRKAGDGAELMNTGPLAKAGSGSLCGVVRRCLSAWAGGCPHLADQENEARKRKSFTESE